VKGKGCVAFEKNLWGRALFGMAIGMGCAATPMGAANGADTTAQATGPIVGALTLVDSYFITQYRQARYNPNQAAGDNANCGPTSLAMAVRAFGKAPSGLNGVDHSFKLIHAVRKAMTGSVDDDTWTYPVQIMQGASQFGLKNKLVFGLDAIKAAMAQPGRLMVININPAPAYADRLAYDYDGGHFALLTAIKGNQAYVNDPLGKGPIVISLAQLGKALTTPLGRDPQGTLVRPFDGGVLLWN
jgi:hypothetical protein